MLVVRPLRFLAVKMQNNFYLATEQREFRTSPDVVRHLRKRGRLAQLWRAGLLAGSAGALVFSLAVTVLRAQTENALASSLPSSASIYLQRAMSVCAAPRSFVGVLLSLDLDARSCNVTFSVVGLTLAYPCLTVEHRVITAAGTQRETDPSLLSFCLLSAIRASQAAKLTETQTSRHTGEQGEYASDWTCAKKIVEHEGVGALYRGLPCALVIVSLCGAAGGVLGAFLAK